MKASEKRIFKMKNIVYKIYLFLILLLALIISFLNCSSLDKSIKYDRNDLKNAAADNSKSANDAIERFEYQKAIEYLKASLRYNMMVDNIHGIVINYANFGRTYLLTKDYTQSLDYYYKALDRVLEESSKIDLRVEKAYIVNGIGETYFILGDMVSSEFFFNMALKEEINLKNEENQALIKVNLAKVYSTRKDNKKALEYLISAEMFFDKLYKQKKLKNIKYMPYTYYSIARRYLALNDSQKALEYVKKAVIYDRLIENPSGIADDYYMIARINDKYDVDESIKYYNKAKELYKYLENVPDYTTVAKNLSEIYYNSKNYIEYYYQIKEVFLLTKGEEKIKAGKNILELFEDKNTSNLFSDEEIKTMTEKIKSVPK